MTRDAIVALALTLFGFVAAVLAGLLRRSRAQESRREVALVKAKEEMKVVQAELEAKGMSDAELEERVDGIFARLSERSTGRRRD